jgi:hypothetical protein
MVRRNFNRVKIKREPAAHPQGGLASHRVHVRIKMQKAMLKSMNIAFCFGCEMNEWSAAILTELK